MSDNQLLSITQVARLKSISTSLINHYIVKGYIPAPQIQAGRKVWPAEQIGPWIPPKLTRGAPKKSRTLINNNPKGLEHEG